MATNPKSKLSPQQAARKLKAAPPSSGERAFLGNVEKKLGPVGPGKHENVRLEALKEWARKKGIGPDAKGKKK